MRKVNNRDKDKKQINNTFTSKQATKASGRPGERASKQIVIESIFVMSGLVSTRLDSARLAFFSFADHTVE